MKSSRTVVEKRRREIIRIIEKFGDVQVLELSENLDVSPITIRRDLQFLEDRNFLTRYYGGAKKLEDNVVDTRDEISESKELIARYAASLIEDGDTIFINTSTTALGMIEYITAKNVTIFTNNGNAINHQRSSSVTIILSGGELRHIKGTMVGEFALDNLDKVIAKKSFLGCSGLSLEAGMTTDFLNEVKINQAMLTKVTGKSYILADYTKFCKKSSFQSCPINRIKNVITDDRLDKEILELYKDMGINIIQVRTKKVHNRRK